MSNGATYTPQPPAAGKKGLPTWAWVLLGCGLVTILGITAVCAGTYFLAKKGLNTLEQKAKEYEANPEKAVFDSVVLGVKMNPELELVASDPDTGEITIREKKTGKEITANFKDIQNGQFSFEADGKEVNIGLQGDGTSGGINVTGPNGERLQLGGGAGTENLPDWLPTYPGSTPQGSGYLDTATERSGSYGFKTTDSTRQVLDHYEQALKDLGFTIEAKAETGDGGMVVAKSGNRNVTVTAGTTNEGSDVGVIFNEKKGG